MEVAQKYSTVDTLRQQYLFIPAKYKVCCLWLKTLCVGTCLIGVLIGVLQGCSQFAVCGPSRSSGSFAAAHRKHHRS